MNRAIITGPTGSIGIALINELVKNKVEVIAVCRPGSKRMSRIPKCDKVKIVECGLEEIYKLSELVKDKANRLDELNKKIDSIIDKITETDNPLLSKKLEEKLVELTDEKALLDEYIATNSEEQEEADFIELFEHLKSIIQTPLAVWNI